MTRAKCAAKYSRKIYSFIAVKDLNPRRSRYVVKASFGFTRKEGLLLA